MIDHRLHNELPGWHGQHHSASFCLLQDDIDIPERSFVLTISVETVEKAPITKPAHYKFPLPGFLTIPRKRSFLSS